MVCISWNNKKCFRDMLSIENKQNYRFKTKSAGTVFTFQYCLIRVPPSARLPRVSPLIHSPSKIECRMTETGHNPLWINLDLAIQNFSLLLFIYSLSCVKFSLRAPRKRVQGVEIELNSFLTPPPKTKLGGLLGQSGRFGVGKNSLPLL
jgi:hypothetical protein